MSEHNGRLSAPAVDQHLADDTSAAGPADPSHHIAEPNVINDENAVMPTAENVVRSALAASGLGSSTNRDAEPRDTTRAPGRIVKEAGVQIAAAASEAAEAAADTAKEVKSAISESAVKASKKLCDKAESSLGPYGSPGTCVPSDLDPLAVAVHAGLDLEGDAPKYDEDDGEGRESCAGVDATKGKKMRA